MDRQTKIVDLTYLKSMSEGNDELIKEMIDIFKKQIPEFLTEINSFYEQGKFESLGALAHKAKSSVYIMGMSDLAAKLKDFELLAKKGEKQETYPNYIKEFEKSCAAAIDELDQLFS